MAESLDSLVNNLPKDAFYSVKREYKGKNLELLTRKGVYPYDYMDTPEKLKETELAPKEAFFLSLITRVSVMKITRMQKKFGMRLK